MKKITLKLKICKKSKKNLKKVLKRKKKYVKIQLIFEKEGNENEDF